MPTQDELIQAELDWTIEQLEAQQTADVEETPTTAEQPAETSAETAQVAEKEEPTETATKKQDSVVKLLKQRNEARAEIESLKAQIKSNTDLEARLKELEESIASQVLEKEAAEEKANFYAATPNAKGHEEWIEKLRAEKDLSYQEAFQLYAAQNDPTLLMDEQYRNKSSSTTTLTGVSVVNTYDKTNPSMDDLAKMSDDEFLAWSDWKARAERAKQWYIR